MKEHYQKTERFFDRVAFEKKGYFDSPRSLPFLVQKKIREKTLFFIKDYQLESILDAGCGRGDFTAILARNFKNAEVIGLDFSLETLNLARDSFRRLSNLEFRQADLLKLPFPDRRFDLVICLNTIHHITSQDLEMVVAELSRVSGQMVVLEFKNSQSLAWPLYKILFKKSNPGISCSGTTFKDLIDLFGRYGFSLKENYSIFKWRILSPNVLMVFKRK